MNRVNNKWAWVVPWAMLTHVAVLPHASVSAAIWYVHADAPPSGDGTSWATAADEIQDIVPPALQPGDQIWIAGGTVNAYLAPVTAYNGVELYGGFPPTGDPGFGFRNPELYPTIIDASGANVGIDVEPNAVLATLIDGFVIENAGVFGISNGTASKARFNSLILRGNGWNPLASASGAFNNGGDYAFAQVTNCVFENNIAVTWGGGFSNPLNSSFLIEGCTFRENEAAYGGAIFNMGAQEPCSLPPPNPQCDTQPIPRVRFCTFELNTSSGEGGAISNGSDLIIMASSFTQNEAGSNGGAIACPAGRLVLQDVSLLMNESGGDGGGVYIVRGCEFSAHSCLFAGNLAANGGALYAIGMNDTILQNCTIVGNSATSFWPGVYASVDYGGCGEANPIVGDIQNNIIWHNGCNDDAIECISYLNQINISVGNGGTLTVDYNDIRNLPGSPPAGWGAHNIDADPEFIDPANLNWRLQATSPCIDAANGEVIPQDGEDADGDSRTVCGGCDLEDGGEHIPDLDLARRIVEVHPLTYTGLPPDDDCPLECGRVPDMGAYERVACIDAEECAAPGDLNGDTVVNGLDIQPFTWCAVYQSEAELPCLCGDFSGPAGTPDSVVNVHDVPCFIELLLTGQNGCLGPIICNQEPFTLKDCNGNGMPDANDIANGTSLDCNRNGVPDSCDLDPEDPDGNESYSLDVNSNDIPDECETDCDADTIPDAWAIADELVADINENGVPDSCDPDCDADGEPDDYELTHGADDCNQNGMPDSCEYDCNSNGVPDDCDVDPLDPDGDTFVSEDCNENGIPDECDLERPILASFDCNDNQIPDECDIASSTSLDANTNGIPDECEEESLLGGGESMMGGQQGGGGEGGGEFDEAAAWEAFFEWYEAQIFGEESDWYTLTGSQRFERVMNELQLLGLPYARPW